MTRSVVTGAAGFVGSHLTERLLALGHDVTGIDSFTDYYGRDRKDRNLAPARAHVASQAGFRFVEDDLLTTDLGALLAGADYVFHLAGQAGVRPSWGDSFGSYIDNNIAVTQRLLEALKGTSIRKLVFASSSSVYGNAEQLPVTEETLPQPVSPYGVTKLAAEHLCSLYAQVYGVPAVMLRLFTVYGPRQRPDMAFQRFLTAAANDESITVYGDGSQTRDFTFVGDIVEAFVLAMDAPPDAPADAHTGAGVFNVCGGTRISLADAIELVRKVTGRPLPVEHEQAARGDARHTFGDHSRATRALGYRPATTLADGIEAQWRWLRESVAASVNG